MLPGIVGGLLLLGAGFAYITYRDLGGLRSINPHEPEDCTPVLGVLSSEDLTIDPDSGVVFISGDDRRGSKDGRFTGAIYSYSLEDRKVQPKNLTPDLEFEFHPHGLSLYRGPDKRKLLFVVNHRSDRDSIEIFEVGNSDLVHQETVTAELLRDANDIVAVDSRRFYVTRDHGYSSEWGRRLEEYFRLGESSVVYYDGQEFRTVAQDLAYANGINASRDSLLIFVAATLEGNILLYNRDPENGSLNLQEKIFLGTAVDNIEVDEDGNLWIGAHPKPLNFIDYSQDPTVLSPSQVLRVSIAEENNHTVEEIYLSAGRYLSGSSVAARWMNHLVIGSVFDRRFLVCSIDTNELAIIGDE